MAKALKPLVIILLLLSIASLVLGTILFGKREVLKGRIQKTEQALGQVAEKLRFADFNVGQLADYETMDAPLAKLATAADLQYEELQTTKKDLDDTKAVLAQTKDDLNTTKQSLESANAQIAQLTDTITAKNAEIAQAAAKAEELNQQITGLQSQITDLNAQVARIEEEKRDLNDKIAEMDQDVKGLEADLANCRGGGPEPRMKKGLGGKIVVVNKDWNFVVIDVGSDEGALVNGVFLVHRSDKLIGKVRVSSVTRNLALAEIVSDWQLAAIKEGDQIVY
jgi:peptidoglycan hydrolase CwlO-like protein